MQVVKIAAVLWLAASLHAQTSRGTVTGTVQDSSGAMIRGAAVTLTSVETGIRLPTSSNETGVYRFDAVDLGAYDLLVTHPGFQAYIGTGIRIEANRVITIDPRWESAPPRPGSK